MVATRDDEMNRGGSVVNASELRKDESNVVSAQSSTKERHSTKRAFSVLSRILSFHIAARDEAKNQMSWRKEGGRKKVGKSIGRL